MTAPLTYRIDWRGIALLVTHTPQQWGMEHIEIESEDRRSFPVSGTGYRSIFLCEEDWPNMRALPTSCGSGSTLPRRRAGTASS